MENEEVDYLKEMLLEHIKNSSNIFLIGHDGPDFDSIGSCIGLYELASALGRKAYIIVNDPSYAIEPGVKKIMDENRDKFRFITRDEVRDLLTKNSLLIMADTNKKNMISVRDNLDWFSKIVIVDHHEEDGKTVQTEHKWIRPEMSSVSEMVARVLKAAEIEISKETASTLLAGIVLDTRNYTIKTTEETHEAAKQLIHDGADTEYVNTLFLEAFESFCRISDLIIHGNVFKKYWDSSYSPIQVSFVLNREKPNTIYLKEDFSKAANRMMSFAGIDGAFAMGFVDDENIHISARSGKRLNVATIMSKLDGGGDPDRAATRIKRQDLLEVEKILMKTIPVGFTDKDAFQGYPQFVKEKK